MRRPIFTSAACFAVQLGFLLLCQSLPAAVNFTLTPSSISNNYVGIVTLQVTGLATGDTVLVQKYLDANTNGVVDAGDLLWQQFNLTDGQPGMVIDDVTNFNVPGDTDTTAGQITAQLYFTTNLFTQNVVGQYLYVLSSPVGHFAPLTNSFAVANFLFGQKFTGNVFSNGTSTTLPNTVVLLFPPPRPGHGMGQTLGGTVANNSGAYTIQAPVGTYTLFPFKTNYVGYSAANPVVALGSGATAAANLSLSNATATISGTVVDANNSSIGLPGMLMTAQADGLVCLGVSGSNGSFTLGVQPVSPNQWGVGAVSDSLGLLGYVQPQNNANINTGATNVTIAYTKATALIYGSIKTTLGIPLVGIDVNAGDNQGLNLYSVDAYTDTAGNYVLGVVGLGTNDSWSIGTDNNSDPTNYILSQDFVVDGGTNIDPGIAMLANFTAILATNSITGNVKYNGSNVVGVDVSGNATINGTNYNLNGANTDSNGNYYLNAPNGDWSIFVSCQGGNNSLDSILGVGNYVCPNGASVDINNNNGTANFIVASNVPGQIFGYVTNTGGGPIANVSVYGNDGNGDNVSTSTDASGYYSFTVGIGTWDVSVDCGQLNSLGYSCVSDDFVNVSGNSVEADFDVSFNSPTPQITTTSLPNATNGTFYSLTFQASGGTPPYSWSIPDQSPPGFGLSTNGFFAGPANTTGTFTFDLIVTDSHANTNEEYGLSITVVPAPPLQITNVSLPNGNVGAAYNAQLGATGGAPPYTWSLALGSASLPPGLLLDSSGLIFGTPTNSGLFSFIVQTTDTSSTTNNKELGLIVNPKPSLSLPKWVTNRFSLELTGAANQNYTVQVTTNVNFTKWSTLIVTNSATANSFLIVDPNATNKQRFYRAIIGP